MPMKRLLLLSAILGLTLPSAQAVQNEIHEKCLKAADYAGCVQVMSGDSTSQESQIDKLVKALKLLPSRLENTNRRDFYKNIQPFSDALGLVDKSLFSSEYEEYIYQNSLTISKLLNRIAQTWTDQIKLRVKFTSYLEPVCENAKSHITLFNYTLGKSDGVLYRPWTQKVLWQTTNGCQDPTAAMIIRLNAFIDEVTEDPIKKQNRLAAEAREKELSAMEPWLRNLEENPNLKKWAESNPDAALKEKDKFLKRLERQGDANKSSSLKTNKRKWPPNCGLQKTKELFEACMRNE